MFGGSGELRLCYGLRLKSSLKQNLVSHEMAAFQRTPGGDPIPSDRYTEDIGHPVSVALR